MSGYNIHFPRPDTIEGSHVVDGSIHDEDIQLDNNEYLVATDYAGTGTVNLIRASTSDLIEFGTAVSFGIITATTVNATTFDTNVAAAAVTLVGTTLAADGTDSHIGINITPKGTGSVVISKADINAGTIDGCTIATSDVTVGGGKTLDVSAGTLTLANDQISGDAVTGGTIGATTITTLGSTTGNITTLNSTTANATTFDTNVAAAAVTLTATSLAADGTDTDISISVTPKGTGSVIISKADINAGTIDGCTIATSDITCGAGKTLDVSAGTLTLANNQISGDNVEGGTIASTTITTLGSTTITATTVKGSTFDTNVAAAAVTLTATTLAADGTDDHINIDITPKGTGEVNITKVDIDDGAIDNCNITVGASRTLDVSAGTLTLAADQISGNAINGGSAAVSDLTATTVYSTTFDTNVAGAAVTLNGITLAADGTDTDINIDITPKGAGEVNITKVDIDDGAIDNCNITVGSSRTLDVSAGTFTLAADQLDEADIRLTNAGWLTARNNAGNGDINILNVNASDAVVLLDASQLATDAAPTTDAQIANKKYVDDEVAGAGGGLTWSVETGETKQAAIDCGYIVNRGGGMTITLPSTAAIGSVIEIVGLDGIWILAQNASEEVFFGNQSTTEGAGGTLTATNAGDCIRIVCIVADTDWRVVSSIGNITVA